MKTKNYANLSYMELLLELERRDKSVEELRNKFDELGNENVSLVKSLAAIERLRDKLFRDRDIAEQEAKIAQKRGIAVARLTSAIDSTIDKLLRQTVAQKSYRERNIELRVLAADLMKIVAIAWDNLDMDDVPF